MSVLEHTDDLHDGSQACWSDGAIVREMCNVLPPLPRRSGYMKSERSCTYRYRLLFPTLTLVTSPLCDAAGGSGSAAAGQPFIDQHYQPPAYWTLNHPPLPLFSPTLYPIPTSLHSASETSMQITPLRLNDLRDFHKLIQDRVRMSPTDLIFSPSLPLRLCSLLMP